MILYPFISILDSHPPRSSNQTKLPTRAQLVQMLPHASNPLPERSDFLHRTTNLATPRAPRVKGIKENPGFIIKILTLPPQRIPVNQNDAVLRRAAIHTVFFQSPELAHIAA